MIDLDHNRRRFVVATGVGVLAGLKPAVVRADESHTPEDAGKEKDVSAVEDLMREHGVIRRAVLVYRAIAGRLRAGAGHVDSNALHRTASLFRAFAEDYHEKRLEETYIFPALKKAGGPAAAYVDILVAQHRRGREITDYILAVSAAGDIGAGDGDRLARALDSIELMYASHAAREDTIVFPAWKTELSSAELDEMSDKFEEIEHEQFGEDGFEHAVAEIGRIEQMFGLDDPAQFTAPLP